MIKDAALQVGELVVVDTAFAPLIFQVGRIDYTRGVVLVEQGSAYYTTDSDARYAEAYPLSACRRAGAQEVKWYDKLITV